MRNVVQRLRPRCSALHFSALTGYSQCSVQFMNKTTLGSSAVLGIRYDFFNARSGHACNFYQGRKPSGDQRVCFSPLFFEENVLTAGETSLTDLINSSLLAVAGGCSSRRICRLGTVSFYLGYQAFKLKSLKISCYSAFLSESGSASHSHSAFHRQRMPDQRFGMIPMSV